MANDWRECKLGDVINLKRGYDLPKRDRVEGKVPIVTSSGVTGYHNVAKAKGPGVVTGRYGTLGEIFYLKEDYWPHNTALYVQDFKGNDPLFISYFLRTLHFSAQNVAGAVPGVNRNYLHLLPVHVPPLPVQHKIADVLSAYDDLIEVNARRIRILEQMAQSVYREWFGKVDAQSLPEGWELCRVGDAFEIVGGSTPSTKVPEYWGKGDINWYSPTDLTANKAMFIRSSGKKITQEGLKNSSAKMFPPYCVMMTSRATIGVVSINTAPACTNQGFITCIPNDRVSVYQIYFWILDNLEKIDNVASGATYKEIGRGEFREFDFIVSDKATKQKFDEIMSPIGRQIEILLAKNANLRRTRDLLLPRLVNGEVGVEELEIV